MFRLFLSVLSLALLAPSALGALLPAIGVCLSGMEWGNAIPGRPGQDYYLPTASEYSYFHSQKLDLVRLPFRWERLQPNLTGPLAPVYLGQLKQQLALAASFNMTVLLDAHNYARYNNAIIGAPGSPVSIAAFADLWRRMATEFVGMAGLHGYGSVPLAHTATAPQLSAALGSPSAFSLCLRFAFTAALRSICPPPAHLPPQALFSPALLTFFSCASAADLSKRPRQ